MSTLKRFKMKTRMLNILAFLFIFSLIVSGIIFVKSVTESTTGTPFRELAYPEYYQLQEQKKMNQNLQKLANDTTKNK